MAVLHRKYTEQGCSPAPNKAAAPCAHREPLQGWCHPVVPSVPAASQHMALHVLLFWLLHVLTLRTSENQ